jgi:hypothetical protein
VTRIAYPAVAGRMRRTPPSGGWLARQALADHPVRMMRARPWSRHAPAVPAAPVNRRAVLWRAVPATVGCMVVVALAAQLGPPHTTVVAEPVGAALLLLLARRVGLTADDMGLGRRSWRLGATHAGRVHKGQPGVEFGD